MDSTIHNSCPLRDSKNLGIVAARNEKPAQVKYAQALPIVGIVFSLEPMPAYGLFKCGVSGAYLTSNGLTDEDFDY
jgi:hypothetical protein